MNLGRSLIAIGTLCAAGAVLVGLISGRTTVTFLAALVAIGGAAGFAISVRKN
jgi:hypothetical protein